MGKFQTVFFMAFFALGFFFGVNMYKTNITSYVEKMTEVKGNVVKSKRDVTVRLPDGKEMFFKVGTRMIVIEKKDGSFLLTLLE